MVEECTGCLGCIDICKVGALDVETMEDGFIYPKIDKDKCVECGKCISVCSFKNPIKKLYPQDTYIAISSDVTNTINSTSGGIFWELANAIISNGGYVCGCVLDQELNPVHIISNKIEDIVSMQGSKYIQSDMSTIYPQINKICQEKKDILFTGTPCQCSAIKLHFPNYEHLYLVDIVCHGVPSAKIFKKYIEFLEKKYEKKVVNYEFRNKDKARWGEFIAKVIFEDGTEKYIKADEDNYYSNFLKGTIYRECCYQCKYANTNRVGDITIGDFWGIEQVNEKFYSRDGVSLVLINSEKGKNFLKNLKESVIVSEQTIEQAVKRNGNLSKPTLRLEIRDNIYKGIDEENFINKKLKIKGRLKNKIKRIIPKKVKNIIKKII